MKRVAIYVRDKVVPLSFQCEPEDNEYEAFLRAFNTYFEKDDYVKTKRLDHFTLFEYQDVEFDIKMEIPLNCAKLPSKSIHVRFSPVISPQKAISSSFICLTEGSDHAKSTNNNNNNLELTAGKRTLDFQASADVVTLDGDQISSIMEPCVQKRGESSASGGEQVPVAHRWTAQTFPVPQLSSRVLAYFEQKTFFKNVKVFVQETGDHFLNVVKKSYPYVYSTYVEALMLHYPQLGDCAREARLGQTMQEPNNKNGDEGADGEVESEKEQENVDDEGDRSADKKLSNEFGDALVELLQNYVNNSKSRMKKKLAAEKKAREGEGEPLQRGTIEAHLLKESRPRKRKAKTSENVSSKGVKLPETPEDLYILLAKRKKSNEKVVCQALALFKEERWATLQKCDEIPDVIKKWPCYSSHPVIQTEFFHRLELDEHSVQLKFENALRVLSLVKTQPISTEGEKIILLGTLENDLRDPAGRRCTRVFTVKTVLPTKATELPKSIDANAPISASYLSSSGVISRCYIRAKSQTILSLEKPTVFDIYKSIVGAYYCFNRAYPAVSKGILDLLDFCVLEREDSTNKSVTLRNLKNEYTRLMV